MRKLGVLICLMIAISTMIGAAEPAAKKGGTSLILNFTSAAIAKGKLGDWANRNVTVYLPASYDTDPNRRYPVVYTFHGFGGGTGDLITAFLPYLETPGNFSEFIIVGVDGSSRRGGSFYVNSSNTGYFEDMVVDEVVPLVDSKLRTIPMPWVVFWPDFRWAVSRPGFWLWPMPTCFPAPGLVVQALLMPMA